MDTKEESKYSDQPGGATKSSLSTRDVPADTAISGLDGDYAGQPVDLSPSEAIPLQSGPLPLPSFYDNQFETSVRSVPWAYHSTPLEPLQVTSDSGFAEDVAEDESIDITEVADRLRRSYELSAEDDEEFMPYDALCKIINPEIVYALLWNTLGIANGPMISNLTTGVLGQSSAERKLPARRKIFAILIMMHEIGLIEDFISGNITDNDLPLKLKRRRSSGSGVVKQLCKRRHVNNLSISEPDESLEPLESLNSWSLKNMEDFASRQKVFCVPIFQAPCEVTRFYDLRHRPILPFLEKSKTLLAGHGNARKIRIHHAHYSHIEACKMKDDPKRTFTVRELGNVTAEAFHQEIEDFERIGVRKPSQISDHLLHLQFSYLHDDRYFLVFPWANGTLREFWRQNDSFTPEDQSDIFWLLSQCKGIARGLSKIHTFNTMTKEPESTSKITLESLMKRKSELWGRHGNIKPESILWFDTYEGMKDHLVLGDFGLTIFDGPNTRFGVPRDAIAAGTYRPPEVDLVQPVTQRYDIWSLGCVFIEFISWFIVGAAETEISFTNSRVNDDKGSEISNISEDKYFVLESSPNPPFQLQANLKPSVSNWILKLQRNQKCTKELHDLLSFIEHEMLQPNPAARPNCGRIMAEISMLLSMCASDQAHDANNDNGAENLEHFDEAPDDKNTQSPVLSDSGSELSFVSSIFSGLSEFTLASTVVPEDLGEEFARLLLRDEQIREFLNKGLLLHKENAFFQKTNHILMKFLGDLRRSTSSELYLRIIRILAKLERQRELTNSIVRLAKTKEWKAIESQHQDDEARATRLQDGLRLEHSRLPKNKPSEEENTESLEPLPSISHWSDDDSEDNEGDVVEPTGNNDSSEDESDIEDEVSLEKVEDYLSSGQPFQTLKDRLEYLGCHPKSISEALTAEGSGVLAVLLEKRFLQIACGEYERLLDLKEMGYSYVEIAELLYQASHDAPWIFFESNLSDTPSLPSAPKEDYHVEGCIHSLLPDNGGMCHSTDLPPFRNDEKDIKRQIEQLCGLCGIAPMSRNRTEWNGSIEFRMDQDPLLATISYSVAQDGLDDMKGPMHRLLQIVKNLQSAAALMQDASFCCQSFTVLTATEVDTNSDPPRVSLRRFEFSIFSQFAAGIERLIEYDVNQGVHHKTDFDKTLSDLGILSKLTLGCLCLAPGVFGPETSNELFHRTMQSISLSVQFLGLGLLSYFQAHTGKLQPFFLDKPLRTIHLAGLDNPSYPPRDSSIVVHFTQLTCLHGMVGDKVMVFYPAAMKFFPETRFDMNAKLQDILDTWGPGQAVFQRQNRNLPVAIGIGGGYITRSVKDGDETYHWERRFKLPDSPLVLSLGEAITIGTLITTNSSCTKDESICWKGLSDHGQLCFVGTHDSFWATTSHEFGAQMGYGGALVAYNRVRQKHPAFTAKQTLFGSGRLRSDFLLENLDYNWAVRMSHCTGVAQRVPLRHMISDLFPVFAEACTAKADYEIWGRLKSNVVEKFNGANTSRQSLKTWLRDLDKATYTFVFWILNMIFDRLRDTGVSADGESFQLAWPFDDRLNRGIEVPINHDFTKWVPILAESKHCATFAYVTNVCLTTNEIPCGASNPASEQRLLLLETAVMSHATRVPTQWSLTDKRDYYFRIDSDDCWVTVEKDASQAPAHATLIHRHWLGKLTSSDLMFGVISRLSQTEKRIREADILSPHAEKVHIISRKPV